MTKIRRVIRKHRSSNKSHSVLSTDVLFEQHLYVCWPAISKSQTKIHREDLMPSKRPSLDIYHLRPRSDSKLINSKLSPTCFFSNLLQEKFSQKRRKRNTRLKNVKYNVQRYQIKTSTGPRTRQYMIWSIYMYNKTLKLKIIRIKRIGWGHSRFVMSIYL